VEHALTSLRNKFAPRLEIVMFTNRCSNTALSLAAKDPVLIFCRTFPTGDGLLKARASVTAMCARETGRLSDLKDDWNYHHHSGRREGWRDIIADIRRAALSAEARQGRGRIFVRSVRAEKMIPGHGGG